MISTYAIVPRPSRTDGLTAREVEILRRVTSGLTNRQLAEELGVSTRTIDAHLRSVYAKLGVKSSSCQSPYAIDPHLVWPGPLGPGRRGSRSPPTRLSCAFAPRMACGRSRGEPAVCGR